MNTQHPIIDGIIQAFLVIIPLGGTARILFCVLSSMANDERKDENKHRIKNVIAFVVFAEIVLSLISMVQHYYGG